MLYAITMAKSEIMTAKPVKIIIKETIFTVPEKTPSTESPFILLNERRHSMPMHDKQRYISAREQIKLHE